ncbi:MAG: 4a-hydroxytetrahydrobiopterin dehydratase [Euryarchaeota archaeon]|nr:4a-hydroxytetrahydrobiopterin dehydratase [Euryarchaeota archaeon]|tara:strand:- start:96 stop:389 length:294 start_codon:yes stop_codon:yes gene_type:complete
MSAVLKDNDVINAIKGMDGWNYDDVYRCIRKEFDFDTFEAAATFVQHVASIANEMGHYPEILIYKKGSVRITATTHDEGGITDNDVALIESVEILVS